jgi:hypothetical protein
MKIEKNARGWQIVPSTSAKTGVLGLCPCVPCMGLLAWLFFSLPPKGSIYVIINYSQERRFAIPTGTVTFLFTDIEGGTKLEQQ